MGKFDGVLICTDLDGTLYRKDKTISQENKEAIEYFKREGGYFTFITGRLPYYSTDAFKAVQPNVPFGCINGGGLYDGSAKEYVWKTELEREALTLVAHIENLYPSVGVQICGFDKTYFAIENETTVWFRRVTALPKILCNYRDFHEPMGKIIFCSNYEDIVLKVAKALSEHKLGERFDFVRSEERLYEILPKGVDKGLALEKLAEYLNVEKRKTIAVGDYDNDVAMLKSAGLGVAVSNASRAALAAADIVTVSNEEHAIARIIYDLESGKIKL